MTLQADMALTHTNTITATTDTPTGETVNVESGALVLELAGTNS
jgi:hypothetical protein